MPMKRVVRTNSNNVYLMTLADNRKNLQQQWYFDEVSKTIKSQQWKHLSLHMSGNHLYARATSSRWF
jgi:hypothetical protein